MVDYRRSQEDFVPMKDKVDSDQYESVFLQPYSCYGSIKSDASQTQ